MKHRFDATTGRRWKVPAAAMLAVLAALDVQTVVGFGPLGTEIVGRFADDVVVVLAAVLCLVRAGAVRRELRQPWMLLAGALVTWSFGTIHQSLFLWDRPSPGATVGDLGWIALYPLSGLAFLAFARAQLGRLDLRLGMDVLIGALALLAFLAGDLREMAAAGGHSLAAWVSISYAVGDLVLVAIAVAIGSATRWQLDRLWLVLLLGFMVTVVGDRLYAGDVAMGRFDSAAVVAATWSCGAALIGLSSGVDLPPEQRDRRRAGAIGLPIVLAFGALAIVGYSSIAPVDPLSILLAAGSLCAALGRLGLTHRDNCVLLDEADEHAHVDPLTGLGNRRGMARDLDVMVAALEPASRLRLSLFDLDGFKAYNDRHGHLAGDDLLERLSHRMRLSVADSGRCYRLGGDEFCLLAAVADGEADTISAGAAAALSDVGVGCSFGSVTMGRDTTLTEALKLADERMYEDKRARRLGPPMAADAVVTYLDSSGDRRVAGHRREPPSPEDLTSDRVGSIDAAGGVSPEGGVARAGG